LRFAAAEVAGERDYITGFNCSRELPGEGLRFRGAI
jgi:hypothetical protein